MPPITAPNPPTRPRPAQARTKSAQDILELDKRVTIIEVERRQELQELTHVHASAHDLRDTLYGTDTEAGVLERLRNLESDIADLKRIGWAILAVLIGLVVTSLYNIITTHSLP